MKYSDLIQHDANLELVYGKGEGEVERILPANLIRAQSLYFIKNKKFYDKWLQSWKKDPEKNIYLIIEKTFWPHLIQQSDWQETQKHFNWVATTSSVDLSLSFLSGPCYEKHTSAGMTLLKKNEPQIHETAQVSPDVIFGSNVKVGAHAIILPGSIIMENVTIGEGTKIYPHVTIYENVTIGKNCRIHAGVVLGSDGFGYNQKGGIHHKVWHMGGVIIGDEVEIGAQSAVDAGTFSPTIIGSGCKIDNQVQIAHNCEIGKGVILCGHVGIAGSCIIGDYCVFAGKSGISSGITLGAGCQVTGGTLVGCDWPAGSILGGQPARPLKEWLRGIAYVRKKSLQKEEIAG